MVAVAEELTGSVIDEIGEEDELGRCYSNRKSGHYWCLFRSEVRIFSDALKPIQHQKNVYYYYSTGLFFSFFSLQFFFIFCVFFWMMCKVCVDFQCCFFNLLNLGVSVTVWDSLCFLAVGLVVV